jgi:hypothetical protein
MEENGGRFAIPWIVEQTQVYERANTISKWETCLSILRRSKLIVDGTNIEKLSQYEGHHRSCGYY